MAILEMISCLTGGKINNGQHYLLMVSNHENFDLLAQYPITEWHGGHVQFIRPHVLHLMRGQIFDINGFTFFCMGGDAPQLIATENWKIKGNICQHGVLVAGSAGTGAFYAHYVLLENSRVVDNIHYNATLDINTDEMRVEYSRGDKDISVEEGEKVTAKLGEAREVEPVWHQLNIEY